MFTVSDIADKSTFQYWFKPTKEQFTWKILTAATSEELGCIKEATDNNPEICMYEDASLDYMLDHESNIYDAFTQFKNSRPEYAVNGWLLYSDEMSCADKYDTMLAGAILTRDEASSQSSVVARIDKCLKWLHSTDFYDAPASTIYHGSNPSGLLHHSLDVANKIFDLYQMSIFNARVNIEDAILVALVHDWCKIDRYESYIKRVKNEQTGEWEPVQAYKWKDTSLPFGHGETSMFTAQKLVHLTTEQALAIRWHMGWTRVHQQDMNDLQNANENYPLVHMLQFADQLSIVNY